MTGIDSWSPTPATNATADGGAINWAEGQPPSSVNNSARQMLADNRTLENDRPWFQYGTGNQGAGNLAVPAVYSSGTAFTITGANVTAKYAAGNRVRAVGSGTGTIYGTISSTSYLAPTTTVNMVWDSGSLSNETLVVSLSQVSVTGSPVSDLAIKQNFIFAAVNAGAQTPITTATATKVTLGTEIYDPNGDFTGSAYTPKRAGKYRLFGTVGGSGASALLRLDMYFYKNGSLEFTPFRINGLTGTSGSGIISASAIITLNGSTDYAELWGLVQATGTCQFDAATCQFSGEWVSA